MTSQRVKDLLENDPEANQFLGSLLQDTNGVREKGNGAQTNNTVDAATISQQSQKEGTKNLRLKSHKRKTTGRAGG